MVEMKPDQTIFQAGEASDSMYVVASGNVRLKLGDHTIAEIGRGQHFGEMALVDRSTHSLTAIASEPTRLAHM